MNQKELLSILTGLSGHIQTTSDAEKKSFESLQDNFTKAIIDESNFNPKGTSFSFENADLFFKENIDSERIEHLNSVAEKLSSKKAAPEYRVFVREVPVLTTQISSSVPIWAGGAAVEKTIGPFMNLDGRRYWYDFYKIEKLVALYLQGSPDPAILFNVSILRRFISNNLPLLTDALAKYTLLPGSVWINSRLIADDSPSGLYTGLKIKGGDITLSNAPQIINDKLIITTGTNVNVNLKLDQRQVDDADPESPYGIDARNMTLELPSVFNFYFSGIAHGIDNASLCKWKVYGQNEEFRWSENKNPKFNLTLNRILIPYTCSDNHFSVKECKSVFNKFTGTADIKESVWALPVAQIDISKPSPASGTGAIVILCNKGLSAQWKGLHGGEVNLKNPWILAEPGRINITDSNAGNIYCSQEYKLWKDDANKFPSAIKLTYTNDFPLIFNTTANGNESLIASANANPLLDRPVTVNSQPLDINSKKSLLILALSKSLQIIGLYDDNILIDNYDPKNPALTFPKPIALAMRNALFTVTPVNGCLLFGDLADDLIKVEKGFLFLTFGMYSYLPSLPDPYAANLGNLKSQFISSQRFAGTSNQGRTVRLWLVCLIRWNIIPDAEDEVDDDVNVSFHFAPLENQFSVEGVNTELNSESDSSVNPDSLKKSNEFNNYLRVDSNDNTRTSFFSGALLKPEDFTQEQNYKRSSIQNRPELEKIWDEYFRIFTDEAFALLDVSSNANQMGVSFASFGNRRVEMMRTFAIAPSGNTIPGSQFPIQIKGMDVVAPGIFAKAFTVPEISWEPVLNLTDPNTINPSTPSIEPPLGPNYYPNDGGPTKIFNNSVEFVPLAPIPLTNFIVDSYKNVKGNITASLFTLPFGMKAIAVLNKDVDPANPPSIQHNSYKFSNNVKGGIQLRFNAGKSPAYKYPIFHGGTFQLNNILDILGQPTLTSNLSDSVTYIFNGEFQPKPNLLTSNGVPLTRIDFSGYGSSIFSDWYNPDAQFAQTSQSKFDVFVGRTAHEVIQVRSMIYPWGIKVVRTIILYRAGNGYVFRVDTGWKAESDGKFDFSYKLQDPVDSTKYINVDTQNVFKYHPGVIKGLFNIQNIIEVGEKFPVTTTIKSGQYYVDDNNFTVLNSGADFTKEGMLKMVEFDTDVEIEDVMQGAVNGRVPAKKMRGYVQLAPRGIPISKEVLEFLHASQGGYIGGPLDCIVDIGKNGQKMRVNRIDSNSAKSADNTEPVFVAAVRGNVILPKDGSWSMVMHAYDTGDVSPLPDNITVPLIRIGQLIKQGDILKLIQNPNNELLRLANPTEILRVPTSGTINFGMLQTTDTQKALFLTPSYKKLTDLTKTGTLLSKTPPLFADSYRILSSKGIFPNIGNAVTTFGDVIKLDSNFATDAATDAGVQVLKIMQINEKDVAGDLKKEGFKLMKQAANVDFPLPSKWDLINEDYLKIYVEYKTENNNGSNQTNGKLNFDVDSFANDVADNWKSKMSNLSMIVDLGPFKRLMKVKGNFDSKKGSETTFPAPQLEFSDVLEPVIAILQILQDLQGANYGDALKKGLKIAMSNSADSWEYKFEASKEIPVVKFPVPDTVYNSPQTPLKLEAGLRVGFYFNAALKITNDANKLLPTAGAFIDFYGRLSVMCVSLAAATVYAVGQVDLGIAADTKVGPSIRMKFGFGAQIVVGLPVVGNVSVLYMVGVEIYASSTELIVTASMLFQGHAELLAGLVSITITIEAKGSVKRIGNRTDCSVQVSFAIEISIFLIINIDFSTSWQENRQIA